MLKNGNLCTKLKKRKFVVTAEISTPKGVYKCCVRNNFKS
ncbi:hypothetical protein TKV_c16760 [Thermoanaerobacter kivui]|uniref:Uncharacterized protein n=1 Tax=Thermoanaerobacter kivui TaxID=2325 RepID=A0A097ASM7_THEKI|nr:hypothetical protein TKV_c16760 [Thermoanaerobacter kivui]